MLIGVCGQRSVFSEAVVRATAANVERPVVSPLSNLTSRAEGIPAARAVALQARAEGVRPSFEGVD